MLGQQTGQIQVEAGGEQVKEKGEGVTAKSDRLGCVAGEVFRNNTRSWLCDRAACRSNFENTIRCLRVADLIITPKKEEAEPYG